MTRSTLARGFFGLTALVVLAGLSLQVYDLAQPHPGARFTGTAERVANMFVFFTIWSNVLTGLTCGLLAVRLDRRSTLFRTLRLTALVGITITGLVYHAVLSGLLDLSGAAKAADELLHSWVPALAVVGWLAFGPRGQVGRRQVRLSLLFLLAWGTLTVVRGAIIHWYPYPFMDVDAHGYLRVALNGAGVALLFVAVGFAAAAGDRALTRDRS
jgi:hypothetical protein